MKTTLIFLLEFYVLRPQMKENRCQEYMRQQDLQVDIMMLILCYLEYIEEKYILCVCVIINV